MEKNILGIKKINVVRKLSFTSFVHDDEKKKEKLGPVPSTSKGTGAVEVRAVKLIHLIKTEQDEESGKKNATPIKRKLRRLVLEDRWSSGSPTPNKSAHRKRIQEEFIWETREKKCSSSEDEDEVEDEDESCEAVVA